MTCGSCGHENKADRKFCASCGGPLDDQGHVVEQSPVSETALARARLRKSR